MTLSKDEVLQHIRHIKNFWKITDFKSEIIDWNFKCKHPDNLVFNIGHPPSSNKGCSVGDVLPYTRLPESIKEKYPSSVVTAPLWFKDFMEFNPYIDRFEDSYVRWGSLGTFGTTVQRTCNVWGIKCKSYTPIVYYSEPKVKDGIIFCVNSKTGGRIKDTSQFESIIEELKSQYWCTQLALKDDYIVRNANEIIFTATRNNLVPIISKYKYYLGAQNSIYHLAKALQLNVIGILPENIIPSLVTLPLLTQINHLELEMLSDEQRSRSKRWKEDIRKRGINPDETHHVGWLYPDSCHFTTRKNGTLTCPPISASRIIKALNNEIYPYGDDRLWDYYKHEHLWCEA